MAAEIRKEPGNFSYEFFRGIEEDSKFVILESYHIAEDFELHSQHSVTANGPAEAP